MLESGRTDAEAKTPILWPPRTKSWLIGKDPDAGRDWGQEEKGTRKAEMAGWHHRLSAHEFGWTWELVMDRGGLAYCNSWGRKELDTTEQLNWTELISKTYCRHQTEIIPSNNTSVFSLALLSIQRPTVISKTNINSCSKSYLPLQPTSHELLITATLLYSHKNSRMDSNSQLILT